jgi:hypothetical protein
MIIVIPAIYGAGLVFGYEIQVLPMIRNHALEKYSDHHGNFRKKKWKRKWAWKKTG